MRNVVNAVRAQANDARTWYFDYEPATMPGRRRIIAVRKSGERVFCGTAKNALALVGRHWKK